MVNQQLTLLLALEVELAVVFRLLLKTLQVMDILICKVEMARFMVEVVDQVVVLLQASYKAIMLLM